MRTNKDSSMDGINQQRRRVIKGLSAGSLSLAGGVGAIRTASAVEADDPWKQAQMIIDRVDRPLTFRAQDFVITDFGAATCQLSQYWHGFLLKSRPRCSRPSAARLTATARSPPPSPPATAAAAVACWCRPATGTAPAPSCCARTCTCI